MHPHKIDTHIPVRICTHARRTDASEALSEALKREGCTFVGPTTCYSFMQVRRW